MADAEEHRVRRRTASGLGPAHLAMQELSRERVEIFGEITAAVTSTLDLRFVLEILMEKIDQLLPYAAIMILLKTKKRGGLKRVACRNIDEVDWRARELEAAPYFSRTVLETRRPLLVNDAQTDPRAVDPQFFRKNGLHSYLGIPLLANGEAIGVLSFLTKEPYDFSKDEIDFLTTLSGQAAIAIHHSQLYEELQARSDTLASLYGLTAEVNESLDLDPVLQKIIERINDIFHFDATGIYFLNPESQLVERRAAWEASAGILGNAAPVKAGEGLVGEVMETGRSVLFADVREEPGYRTQSGPLAAMRRECAFLGLLPIKSRHRTVGVLVGAARERRELDDGDLELLRTIANQIGVAHEKSALFYETRVKANQLSAFYALATGTTRADSDVMAAVSYELRTQLHMIMGHVALLLGGHGGVVTNVQRRSLETVHDHSRALLRLVDNVRDLYRIEVGRAMGGGARSLEGTLEQPHEYVEQLNRQTDDDDSRICACGHRERVHVFEVCAVQRCNCRHYEPKKRGR